MLDCFQFINRGEKYAIEIFHSAILIFYHLHSCDYGDLLSLKKRLSNF